MKPFLKQVAQYVYDTHKEGISNITFVFPGKRVSLFFLRYLAEIAGKPLWSPTCFTIQELMQHISGKQATDNLQLVFELYNIYRQELKTNESFDDFYFWGEMLLADFDDIDKYLVNAADLFQNLSLLKTYENLYNYLSDEQIKNIQQFWGSFSNVNSYEMQQRFVSVWSVLYPVYQKFRDYLIENQLAYEGMVYRDVAERIQQKRTLDLPSEKIVFIGFNALNTAEKKLFEHLKIQGIAEFFWDFDISYIYDPVHQAGFFLRDNLTRFPSPVGWKLHEKVNTGRKVKVFSVGSDIAQVKTASSSLNKLAETVTIEEDTAWILADESLLPQVLDALPDAINDVNITMGFPMRLSQTYGFLESLFTLYHYRKRSDNQTSFYFKHVIHLLQHPFLLKRYKSEIQDFIQRVQTQNQVYINSNNIPDVDVLQLIFHAPMNIFEWLRALLEHFIQANLDVTEKSESEKLELEFLFHVYTAFNQIEEQLDGKGIEVSLPTLRRMVYKIIRNFKVPFSGEPLKGLQVLGLLETRAVDFKNIFILSFNEGIYPKTSASPSFIPYNLRKGFGLPTLEHQDSIFAYYFYRLMQRAERVELFYNSKSDGLSSGERSRFLHQMIYQQTHDVEEIPIKLPLSTFAQRAIEIGQSEETTEKLQKYTPSSTKILSPSALNVYLDCSLKFYFRYIAEIPEPEEVSEEVDAAIFGNILHDAMEAIFNQRTSTVIDRTFIDGILAGEDGIESIVETAFQKNYAGGNRLFSATGSNAILKKVITSYCRQILKVDLMQAPFEIVELEKEHKLVLPVSSNPGIPEVVIGGKIDRIDRNSVSLRIIDYKTGKAEHGYNKLSELFEKDNFKRNKAAFQTFFYSYIYQTLHDSGVQPGLYPVKNIYNANFDFRIFRKEKQKKIYITNFKEIRDEFQMLLKQLVNDMFSPNEVYKQTKDVRICAYCPYKNICRK